MFKYSTEAKKAFEAGADIRKVFDIPARELIARAKYISEQDIPEYVENTMKQIEEELTELTSDRSDER